MIPGIRLATQEEVDKIASQADLTPTSVVWSWPNDKGETDTAVIRQCTEVDPVIFAATSGKQRKALYFWVITNMARVMGLREIYFQLDADASKEYVDFIKKLGAEATTTKPQIRYKLVL